jgi:hypothetical protein
MTMNKLFFIGLLTIVFCTIELSAASRYWIGVADNNWNNTGNWSTSSGGGGGASVPGSGDVANFDVNGNVNCTLNAAVNIAGLTMTAGYTATITHSTNTIALGTSGATLSGGTFAGGSASITATGAFTISGCAFTSTSGTFNTNSNFTVSSGSFTHNSGLMKFTATNTISASVTMYQVEFAPALAATYTIAGGTTLTISNTMTISGTVTATFNTGNINANGNVVITNTAAGSGGSAILTISGSGNQLIDGVTSTSEARLPNVVINKSGGTLTLQDFVNVTGNWTRTAGDVDPGTSTVAMLATKTISGTDTLYNVVFASGGTFTISGGGSTLNILHTFTNQGSIDQTFNTGTINAYGDIVVTNTATGGGGNATVNICGSTNQTLDGSAGITQGRFPNLIINKSGGTLYLQDYIPIVGNWTRTAGDTDPGTSTVGFSSTKTISGTDTLYNCYFGGGASTFTISNTINVLSTLTIAGSTFALTFNTGTINAKGDVTVTNTATGSGGTATIVLTGTASQTITGSGTAGGGRLPNITIDKSGGTLTMASVISCTGNWIYTQGTVSPTTSTVAFYGTMNLDGQEAASTNCMPFYNITINGNTRTLTGHLDCNNDFTIASAATCSAGSNKIYVGGNWNSAGTWTYATSTVVFDGNGYNKIQGATGIINFYNVEFNRITSVGVTPKNIRLLNPIRINTSLTMNKGRVYATTTNYLSLVNDATCTVTNNDSAYVHGPVRKAGNDAFTFPLGDTTLHDSIAYHPLVITAPGAVGDTFEAIYYATTQTAGSAKAATLYSISTTQYWTLNRRSGTSTPTVSLSWNRNGDNTAFAEMRVAEWTGAQWTDRGQASTTITNPTGLVTASSALSFGSNPAPLVIAYAVVNKSYAVLHKSEPASGYHSTDGYVLYFAFEDEYDDANDSLSFRVVKMSTDRAQSILSTPANRPLVRYGTNSYKLDLYDTGNTPLTTGYYMLEVTNEKSEKYFLRFKI